MHLHVKVHAINTRTHTYTNTNLSIVYSYYAYVQHLCAQHTHMQTSTNIFFFAPSHTRTHLAIRIGKRFISSRHLLEFFLCHQFIIGFAPVALVRDEIE